MNSFSSFLLWSFTNIVIAILPIITKLSIVGLFKTIKLNHWHEVIQDGELFIFSTTISASSMVSSLLAEETISPAKGLSNIALMIVIIFSSFIFGIVNYAKLSGQNPGDIIAPKRYVLTSIACSCLAIGFSYVIRGE